MIRRPARSRLARLRRLHALALFSELSADPCTPERRTRARRSDRIARACRMELNRMAAA
ncbi:hypothetical protein [Deinococcus marmoris]|uniref:Uncharacterized protein n=1 Tax=Deinococcus marmoris TaxID=249408 RepID=A0A1U7P4T1_9DEIO|nr:hypothetical protein [Deinococcus marmoris]OLV20169.1 hypothetical protein BOO71_0000535 [Deinococcus marmoris]